MEDEHVAQLQSIGCTEVGLDSFKFVDNVESYQRCFIWTTMHPQLNQSFLFRNQGVSQAVALGSDQLFYRVKTPNVCSKILGRFLRDDRDGSSGILKDRDS
jgi:hypothetical protein